MSVSASEDVFAAWAGDLATTANNDARNTTARADCGCRYCGEVSRRDEILGRHRDAIRNAAARRKASSISLAGSVARGTDSPGSDIDFVCEWAPGASLFDASGLLVELEELLGCPVDISSARMLEPPYTSLLDDAIAL